jgi:hypothetical protein
VNQTLRMHEVVLLGATFLGVVSHVQTR